MPEHYWRTPLPPEITSALEVPYSVTPPAPEVSPLELLGAEGFGAPPVPQDEEIEILPDEVPPVPALDDELEVTPFEQPPVPQAAAPALSVERQGVAAAGQAIEKTQADIAALDARKAELMAQYGQSEDPVERQELARRAVALEAAKSERRAQLTTQRTAYDEEAAVSDAQLQQQVRETQLAAQERAAQELAVVERRDKALASQYEVAQRSAAAEVSKAKEAVSAKLKAGPQQQQSWGVVMADVIAEGINASMQRRPVNLDRIFDRYAARNAEVFAREVQAGELDVEVAGDRVGELARQAQQAKIDAQVARAAIAEQVERDLTLQISRATTDAQRAQLEGVRDLARRSRESALLQAQSAAEDAELNRELKRAQIAKARADAARAAQAARGPGIAAPSQAVGVRESTAVYLPGTDIKIADFQAGRKPTSTEEKRATEANKVVSAAVNYQQQLNSYIAKVEDYGQRGITDAFESTQSSEYRELETLRNELAGAYAKVRAGAGLATTQADEIAAKNALVPPTAWWQRADSAAVLETLRGTAEDRLRAELNPYLNTASQEQLIAHARKRSVSRRDARAAFADRAYQVTVDPDAPVQDRTSGIDTLVVNAKKKADDEGREGQWHADAAENIVSAYREVLQQEPSPARDRVLRSAGREAASIREQMRKLRDSAERREREASLSRKEGGRLRSKEEEEAAVQAATARYDAAIRAIDEAFFEGLKLDAAKLRKMSPDELKKAIRAGHKGGGNAGD